ncbi:MAG: hypothetical protein IPK44_03025 [Candidatus Accumulibacter sp.]|uniref:hypothetical protein n=1 Tax=Accumulibacter sp. TaxID=2053492 RepID=UPI00258B7317|nr:hypothetical protein [Accumulibacter sp.]MBK8113573.1 hypothetical protein [Accumulibacter sp.]
MSESWVRLWSGATTDPKWQTIARKSGQPRHLVIALFVHLMLIANDANVRGDVGGLSIEDAASAMDCDEEQVEAIINAMQGRVISDGRLSGWDARQIVRQDAVIEGSKPSAQRVREHRQRMKNGDVTRSNACNADVTRSNAPESESESEVNQHPPTPSAIPVAIKPESASPVGAAGGGSGFAEFWLSYPKKVGKAEAERKWKNLKPDAGAVLSAVKRQSASEQWRRDGGQYIPNPATWLHQRRWEDEPAQPPANSPSASADRASRYGGVDPFAGAI